MSDSVQPHRRQPTRLPRPWDSPGKNTGVGCHFLLQCMKVKSQSCSVVSDSSQPHGLQPTRLLCPWDFPGKSTGVGCHHLLQDFIYLGSKITVDSDCSHEIKSRLLFGRKAMTNTDSILKSRNITLPTKICIVKAIVLPVFMYRCENLTIKEA